MYVQHPQQIAAQQLESERSHDPGPGNDIDTANVYSIVEYAAGVKWHRQAADFTLSLKYYKKEMRS